MVSPWCPDCSILSVRSMSFVSPPNVRATSKVPLGILADLQAGVSPPLTSTSFDSPPCNFFFERGFLAAFSFPNFTSLPASNITLLPRQKSDQPHRMDDGSFGIFAKEVTRLWRAWRTVHEMVQDRVCRPHDLTNDNPLRSLGEVLCVAYTNSSTK